MADNAQDAAEGPGEGRPLLPEPAPQEEGNEVVEPEAGGLCDDDWFEVDSCCGCCDLQVGAKVIAIMGVVQGLTNCMSISTAGFLAAPTLFLGCLSVGFSLYGFWGAQKCDAKKIRIHMYWLVVASVLLVAVSLGRIYTSQQFCATHNCVVDHLFYPDKSHTGSNQPSLKDLGSPGLRAIPADKAVAASMAEVTPTWIVKQQDEPSLEQIRYEEAIPIYREPCYVSGGEPSADVCTQAHKLSALTTICITVPLNLYFAFIIRSLHNKVVRGELPVFEVMRPIARPIRVGHPIPPMTVYEARSLDGAPLDGSCDRGTHREQDSKDTTTVTSDQQL